MEKTFAKDTYEKGLLSKTYKEYLKLNNKKANKQPNSKWMEDISTSPKMIHREDLGYEMLHVLCTGNCKLKQEDTTTYLLKSQNLKHWPEMPVRIWSKQWAPLFISVGTVTGTATLQDSLELFYETKYTQHTIPSSCSLLSTQQSWHFLETFCSPWLDTKKISL